MGWRLLEIDYYETVVVKNCCRWWGVCLIGIVFFFAVSSDTPRRMFLVVIESKVER